MFRLSEVFSYFFFIFFIFFACFVIKFVPIPKCYVDTFVDVLFYRNPSDVFLRMLVFQLQNGDSLVMGAPGLNDWQGKEES